MVYQIRCSYCGCYMGEKDAPANAFAIELQAMGQPVETHSVCEQCKSFILQDIYSIKTKGEADENR